MALGHPASQELHAAGGIRGFGCHTAICGRNPEWMWALGSPLRAAGHVTAPAPSRTVPAVTQYCAHLASRSMSSTSFKVVIPFVVPAGMTHCSHYLHTAYAPLEGRDSCRMRASGGASAKFNLTELHTIPESALCLGQSSGQSFPRAGVRRRRPRPPVCTCGAAQRAVLGLSISLLLAGLVIYYSIVQLACSSFSWRPRPTDQDKQELVGRADSAARSHGRRPGRGKGSGCARPGRGRANEHRRRGPQRRGPLYKAQDAAAPA